MTVWIRTFPCGVCGGQILYDDDLWTLTCKYPKKNNHPCLVTELKGPMPNTVRDGKYVKLTSLPNCVDAGCPLADPETGACEDECCIAHPKAFFEGPC